VFRSRKRLEAENLALRHQVAVLRRSAPRRLRLRSSDRLLFALLYRLWPGVMEAIVIVHSLKPLCVGIGTASGRSGAGSPGIAWAGLESLQKCGP